MRIPVKLPQFGESAAEATIMAWLVEPGATITAEQDLVEVQTEKSVLTVAKWDGWPLTEEELKWQLEFFGA